MEDKLFELEQFLEMVKFDKQMFIDKFTDDSLKVETVINLLNIYIDDIEELLGE